MAELAEVARSPDRPGAESDNLFRQMLEIPATPPDTITSQFFKRTIPEAERERILFTNLKKHPKFRHSLPSINAARAFKYGSRSFGRKQWYNENFDVVKGLKNVANRRAFRFGLKANVDFLIQLDLETLKSCLLDKTFDPNPPPTNSQPHPLSNGSFLDTMRTMDYPRFQHFCTVLKRIQSNLEFTQSLSEYFATDDMLEPALLVVSRAIRRNLNLEKSLRGGSVAAQALLYRHRASPRDHDFSARRSFQEPRTQNSSSIATNFSRSKKLGTPAPVFPVGTCWRFQATNSCTKDDCQYDHACCHCHSKSHGKRSCPDLLY